MGKEKLGSSGLTTDVANTLGLYEIPSAMQLNDRFDARPSLVIPYMGLDGLPMASHPKWPDFYRIRYLEKGKDFKALATDKEQRYAQPPRTGTCAYFPATEKWTDIAKDWTIDLIITEGELKAAAACMNGWHTIGLGGVWNFRATGEGWFFLPELEKINWRLRNVYICFDSDYAEKPQVCGAINRLGEELQERGAVVRVLLLPDVTEDGKTGLDDYFLIHDNDDFKELLEQSEHIGMGRALWGINKEILYVENPGLIVVEETAQKIAAGQFKEHSRWATVNTVERTVSAEGEIKIKKVPAAPVWLRWPFRRSVTKVTYEPGQPKITENNEFNQWPGWGCKPVKGNVKPFLQLVDFLFADMEKNAKEWFLDWLAFPIQNPGVKMFSAVLVWGVVQGTGKSLIGYSMGQVYGKNFKEIKDENLEGGYTSWAENKQFIMGDEISGSDNRQYANTLKRLVSQRTVEINVKYIPEYDVPDCINYYFTSNHGDAFFLEDTDRRYVVVEVTGMPLEEQFYTDYDKWLWKDGGPSALFHWLLERKISSTFNPAAAGPRTKAKERMIQSGKGDLASWVGDMTRHPEQILRFGAMRYTRDLFTSKELLAMYEAQHINSKVSAVGLGRALSTAGLPQMDGGAALRGPDGTMGRYFAVRNVAYWRKVKDRKVMEKNLALPPVREGK